MAAEPVLRSDARRNRLAILEAAAAEFAERGLDVGVAQIAKRAGVGPATLFRHFPTKDDLVAAILEQRSEAMLAAADEALELADEDPIGALEQFLEAGTAIHVADRGFLQAAITEAVAEEHMERFKQPFLDKVGALLDAAKAAGAVRPDVHPVDLPMCMQGASSACMKYRDANPGMERRFIQVFLDGLRATDAGPIRTPPPDLG